MPFCHLPPMVLASGSPRRKSLLEQLGCPFDVCVALVEESKNAFYSPEELCMYNASLKAHAVAKSFYQHLVLGADTLVFLEKQRLGKPQNLKEARHMLATLSGRSHEVCTGLCLLHKGKKHTFFDKTCVTFKKLSSKDIDNYLLKVHVLDKAGSYAAQDHAHLILDSVCGDYHNVIGLPLKLLRSHLEVFPFSP